MNLFGPLIAMMAAIAAVIAVFNPQINRRLTHRVVAHCAGLEAYWLTFRANMANFNALEAARQKAKNEESREERLRRAAAEAGLTLTEQAGGVQ
jgi:hypothetical protein